jgi:LEA14-like dessication related protein
MRLYKFFFLCIVLLTFSCSQPKPFVFKGIQSIKIEKASWGKNIFKADFMYENPNNFSLTLQKLEADVFINDKLFTHYKLDTTFSIPAEATFKLPATMQVELTDILKNSVDIIFNRPMKINVKGISTLSKGMFTKIIPIEFETTQKLNLAEALR